MAARCEPALRRMSARKFDVVTGDRTLGSVELRVPGAMNVENALAAIAIGHELDLPFVTIAAALRRSGASGAVSTS